MPFLKLRLKKSKQQYNVVSKSVFVITVELLDNSMLECTLTSDSTGRHCLDNVCQRLGMYQPELLGLRYVSRRSYPKIRWVDLERPLKKQLDKYAVEPYLHLGVMFYVNDVSRLEDDVTRYHYFLQLKLDVIEGRLRCNYEQAIVLASYSLQAEFGDHDPERYTRDYLQDFPLLPKPMIPVDDPITTATLTDAIITQHASLAGIAQQVAEVYYIVGAQQLDGYGQECFLAKDEYGKEVLIGASLTGIVVRKGDGQTPKFFKWKDITNLVNHKRFFGIECQNYEFSAQFMLDEIDAAKYVWKMCVLQHTFYKMHLNSTRINGGSFYVNRSTIEHVHNTGVVQSPPIRSNRQNIVPQRRMVVVRQIPCHSNWRQTSQPDPIYNNEVLAYRVSGRKPRKEEAQVDDLDKTCVLASGGHGTAHFPPAPPRYRPTPDYETAIRDKYLQQQQRAQLMYASQPSLICPPTSNISKQSALNDSSQLPLNSLHTYSTPELNESNKISAQDQIVAELQRLNIYKPPPPYPYFAATAASNSTPDLAAVSNSAVNMTACGSSPNLSTEAELKSHVIHNVVPSINYVAFSQSVSGVGQLQPLIGSSKIVDVKDEEPIYQNQLRHCSDDGTASKTTRTKEPIYQNLPIHERIVSETFDEIEDYSKDRCHLGVTNSRQDIRFNTSLDDTSPVSLSQNQHRTTLSSSKPRAGKKRWTLSFGGNKTGSLKSIKSNAEDNGMLDISHTLKFSSPSRMPKEAIGGYLEAKIDEPGEILREFEMIPKRTSILHSCTSVANMIENLDRNRFPDVVPYNDNRVRLAPPNDSNNKTGYINASYISVTMIGQNEKRSYIATQSPMTNTLLDFWQMIYESNVQLIVMLSSPGAADEIVYTPKSMGSILELRDFRIFKKFSSDSGSYCTSTLELRHRNKSDDVRRIWHLQFIDWGDQGCPADAGKYLKFMEEIDSLRRSTTVGDEYTQAPILVHCSAGVGRTGVAILIDILLYCLDHSIDVDIPKILTNLRQQRMLMVQTLAQYKFVHSVLIKYLTMSRLI